METKPKITVSNNWRNTVKIKHTFTDDTTPEKIIEICDILIPQLEAIKEKEAKGNLTDYYKGDIDNKLFELIDHFGFLKNLAEGAIPESTSEHRIPEDEWENYSFDGDFEQWFNDYLSELYDLGDERVDNKHNVREKFLWIE